MLSEEQKSQLPSQLKAFEPLHFLHEFVNSSVQESTT